MNDQDLVTAIKSGDFAAAQPAIADYSRQIHAALEAASGPAAREAIFRQSIEALNQHLSLARVLRAHLAAEIEGNAGSCLYEQTQADRHCWQLEG